MPSRTRLIKDMLWFLALFGLVAGVFRLWFGLGATTNMSDPVPWGLWKILNMVAGVALSTSGFTMGILVYVLRLEQFRALVKPAILLAFLGYGCSMLALLFDIGLPHRFWHPIVMWNGHSFLFEVFWCVLLYFTVSTIELSPSLLERVRAKKLVRALHHVAFGVVVVGIALSSLHHSSLGSLFLVTPLRLHELWYSSWLPWFFILSAMGGGLMVLLLARIIYARLYDPEPVFGPQRADRTPIVCGINGQQQIANTNRSFGPAMPHLEGLATIAVSILALAFVLKLIDLTVRGAWHTFLGGTWESRLFAMELFIGTIVPIVLVILRKTRRTPVGLGLAALSGAAGLALNRLNVGVFGYFRDAGTIYFPSLAEWALSVGVIAAAGLVFLFVVENFAIFDDGWRDRLASRHVFSAVFDRWSHVWYSALMSGLHRVTLIAVFTIPIAWIALYPPFHHAALPEHPVEPATGQDPQRLILCIDGDRSGVKTIFAHADHKARLGGDSSCVKCHHVSLPQDRSTPCSRCHRDMLGTTHLFDHLMHERKVAKSEKLIGLHPPNRSCEVCHFQDQPRTAVNTKDCFECHKDDMWLGRTADSTLVLTDACAFREAMHSTCIKCHREERDRINKPALAECYTCHTSMTPRDALGPRVVAAIN